MKYTLFHQFNVKFRENWTILIYSEKVYAYGEEKGECVSHYFIAISYRERHYGFWKILEVFSKVPNNQMGNIQSSGETHKGNGDFLGKLKEI